MKDLTKYFIDLSKCTEEQQNHIFSLLPEHEYSMKYEIFWKFTLLHFVSDLNKWIVHCNAENKTELTYTEFIKLFEGGEGEKSDLEVWLNRQIEKCQQLDMPREEWTYIQVLKKINSNQ